MVDVTPTIRTTLVAAARGADRLSPPRARENHERLALELDGIRVPSAFADGDVAVRVDCWDGELRAIARLPYESCWGLDTRGVAKSFWSLWLEQFFLATAIAAPGAILFRRASFSVGSDPSPTALDTIYYGDSCIGADATGDHVPFPATWAFIRSISGMDDGLPKGPLGVALTSLAVVARKGWTSEQIPFLWRALSALSDRARPEDVAVWSALTTELADHFVTPAASVLPACPYDALEPFDDNFQIENDLCGRALDLVMPVLQDAVREYSQSEVAVPS